MIVRKKKNGFIFVKVKRALKIFFIQDDFSIFSDSEMSFEDFFYIQKKNDF